MLCISKFNDSSITQMVVLRRCKGNHHFGFSKRKTDGNGKFLALFSIFLYLKIIHIMLNSRLGNPPYQSKLNIYL